MNEEEVLQENNLEVETVNESEILFQEDTSYDCESDLDILNEVELLLNESRELRETEKLNENDITTESGSSNSFNSDIDLYPIQQGVENVNNNILGLTNDFNTYTSIAEPTMNDLISMPLSEMPISYGLNCIIVVLLLFNIFVSLFKHMY